MSDLPTTPDREQQKADNNASRRQSGLEPLPKDQPRRDEPTTDEAGPDSSDPSDLDPQDPEAESPNKARP